MWNTPEPFDPSEWEIVWPYPEVGPAPPLPPIEERFEPTRIIRRHLQKHAPKWYTVLTLGTSLKLSKDQVRSAVRHLVEIHEADCERNAEGHLVYRWAGPVEARVYSPRHRARLQGAA